MTDESSGLRSEELIVRLVHALHRVGAPAHRLENVADELSRRLGTRGHFFSTPTAIIASFGDGPHPRTHLLRVEPGELDLGKQVLLDAVLGDVLAERCTLAGGLERIADVEARPPPYGRVATTAAFAITSASAAVFFGGSWVDLALSAVVGTLIGLLAWLASHSAAVARLFETLAAFVAMSIALASAALLSGVSATSVALAGLIVLVPGLTFTVAMTELATRHLVAGTARFMAAVVIFLQLGFGVAMAQTAGRLLGLPAVAPPADPVPTWLVPVAVVTASIGFTVLFRARRRDIGWVLAAGALAYATAWFAGRAFGPTLGAFLGSFVVAIASTLRARWQGTPASVTLVPGFILLVPGSLGFRSVQAFLEQDVLSALDTGFQMFMVGVALVGGILLANLAVSPRRAL